MNPIKINYLNLSGEGKKTEIITSNYYIQENTISSKHYYLGNYFSKKIDKKIKIEENSIYSDEIFTTQHSNAFKSDELLNEVSKYGKEIYKIIEHKIKFLNQKTNILQPTVLYDAFDNSNNTSICNVVKKWCQNYGFPIPPIKQEIIENEIYYYELPYTTIKEVSLQFVLIYLLNQFFLDFSFYYNTYDENLFYSMDETTVSILNRISKFSNLFGFQLPKLYEKEPGSEYKTYSTYKTKKKLKTFTLKNLIIVLNIYSDYFNHTSKKYFSYHNNKIYHQNVYNNIFDICWDTIATNYSLFTNSTRKCKTCGEPIPAITDKQYCNNCKTNLKSASQESQAKKTRKIEELINFYNKYELYISDDDFRIKNKIQYYYDLLHKPGNSDKLKKTPQKEIRTFLEELQENIKNSNL